MVFSRAGNLSDPNMDPEFLAHLVMVLVNKKTFKPSLDQIKDKYYELFRGLGGDDGNGDDNEEDGGQHERQSEEHADQFADRPI